MTLAIGFLDPILTPLYKLFGAVLAFFYSIVPNIGLAIFLLTVVIMALLYPLTAKQAKSQVKLQLVQPEIKKIQQQYKDDKAKMNEEVMKFYSENKVNPFAACLPLIAQAPVLLALFSTLRDVQKYVPTNSDLYKAFCGELAQTACKGDAIKPVDWFFGILDVRTSALPFDVHPSLLTALPYFFMVGVVGVLGFVQGWQNMRTATGEINPAMKTMSRIFPIISVVFSIYMPSGLVLYFMTSSAWRLGQSELVFRKITQPARAANEKKNNNNKAIETKSEVVENAAPPRKRKRRK